MKKYLALLEEIILDGRTKSDRTGSGVKSIFGPQIRFDLSEGFPLVTTRKIFTRGIIEELLWFIRGETNNESLVEKNVHIWTPWALKEDTYKERLLENHERAALYAVASRQSLKEVTALLNPKTELEGNLFLDGKGVPRKKAMKAASKGDLGPVYGKMWRSWPNPDGSTIDQISTLIENLKVRPYSRRHIVSGWNPSLLPEEGKSHEENILNGKQCLPPCHTLFQFMVEPMTLEERMRAFSLKIKQEGLSSKERVIEGSVQDIHRVLDEEGVPKDRLSCKLYQR